jgi:5-methylcytosine-specific restriction endonuclease McrA
MSPRSVTEWVGATSEAAIPARVKVRVFERANGKCAKCSRRLYPGQWQCDHVIPLIAGGRHAESNLQPLCASPCHSQKTAADVAEKSRVYRRKASHLGLTPGRKKIAGRGFEKMPAQRNASRPIEKWKGFQ